MLAKCSRCAQTFQTDRFGEQQCPFCGATVAISPPNAPPAAMIAPPVEGEGPTQDQPAPVDEPSAHGGFLVATFTTWRRTLFDPQAFFSRLRPGPSWSGAVGFALVCVFVGGPFVGLNTALTLVLQLKGMADQAPELAQFAHQLSGHGPALYLAMAIGMPFVGLFSITLNTLLYHLALILVGGNKAGFTATLRATTLSMGPYLLGIVPFCGSTLGSLWLVILPIYALSQLHRISIGRSIGAWAVTLLITCCCCGTPAGGIGAYLAVQFASHAAEAHGKHGLDLPPMDDLPDNP